MNQCPYCGTQLFGNPYTCFNCHKELAKHPSSEPTYYCLGCKLPIDPNAPDSNHYQIIRDVVSNWTQSPKEVFRFYYHSGCSFKAESEIEYINNPRKRLSNMMTKSAMEESNKSAAIQSIAFIIFLIVALIFMLKDCI